MLPGGTAYITDVGMTGPRGGVIGVKREQAIEAMVTQMPVRFETSDEDPWLNGVVIRAGRAAAGGAIEQVLLPAQAWGGETAGRRQRAPTSAGAAGGSSAPDGSGRSPGGGRGRWRRSLAGRAADSRRSAACGGLRREAGEHRDEKSGKNQTM